MMPNTLRYSRLLYHLLKPWFKVIMQAGFRLQVIGRDNVVWLCQQPLILAGNHTGLLDGPTLVASAPCQVRFMVHRKIFNWPVVGPMLRALGALPVDGAKYKQSLAEAFCYVKHNGCVCIFPEGKLTSDGEMAEFNPGVVFFQEKTQAPIVPFAIEGGFEAWPWGRWFPSQHTIRIAYGQPIFPSSRSKEAVLAELREAIMALKQQLKELNLAPQPVRRSLMWWRKRGKEAA